MKIKNRLTKLEGHSLHVENAPRIIFLIAGGIPKDQHSALSYTDAKDVKRTVFREIDENNDALLKRTEALASKGRGKDKIEILTVEYI
jgi:hypothetical protein